MEKEEFLALAESRYDALRKLKGNVNFYDLDLLEVGFAKLWQELGREVLEKTIEPGNGYLWGEELKKREEDKRLLPLLMNHETLYGV